MTSSPTSPIQNREWLLDTHFPSCDACEAIYRHLQRLRSWSRSLRFMGNRPKVTPSAVLRDPRAARATRSADQRRDRSQEPHRELRRLGVRAPKSGGARNAGGLGTGRNAGGEKSGGNRWARVFGEVFSRVWPQNLRKLQNTKWRHR